MAAHEIQSGFVRSPEGARRALEILSQRFGETLSQAKGVVAQHANNTSLLPAELPEAVFFPETTEEVAETVQICARHGLPVIPFGVGSSLEGGVNAPFGGLSIDMGRMNMCWRSMRKIWTASYKPESHASN